jgi:hypothetical protein
MNIFHCERGRRARLDPSGNAQFCVGQAFYTRHPQPDFGLRRAQSRRELSRAGKAELRSRGPFCGWTSGHAVAAAVASKWPGVAGRRAWETFLDSSFRSARSRFRSRVGARQFRLRSSAVVFYPFFPLQSWWSLAKWNGTTLRRLSLRERTCFRRAKADFPAQATAWILLRVHLVAARPLGRAEWYQTKPT